MNTITVWAIGLILVAAVATWFAIRWAERREYRDFNDERTWRI